MEGVRPKSGFWSPSFVALFAFCNVVLLREGWGARILPIIAWRRGQYEKEGLCQFKPSPWTTFWLIRCLCINCPSRGRLRIIFPRGLSSFTFYFCSKFASSFPASQFHKYLYYLKRLVVNCIVCFSLVNTVMCFIDYIIALLSIAGRSFLCLFRKSQVVIVVFRGSVTRLSP